ncbi:hypothetical protein Tco_1451479, partial [Tanacetum coccineum]
RADDGLHLPVITSWLDGLFPYGIILLIEMILLGQWLGDQNW